MGSGHINTCDEWRDEGAFTVESVDIAPTLMALLGLPVPRHAVGVFIDDIVGTGSSPCVSPLPSVYLASLAAMPRRLHPHQRSSLLRRGFPDGGRQLFSRP